MKDGWGLSEYSNMASQSVRYVGIELKSGPSIQALPKYLLTLPSLCQNRHPIPKTILASSYVHTPMPYLGDNKKTRGSFFIKVLQVLQGYSAKYWVDNISKKLPPFCARDLFPSSLNQNVIFALHRAGNQPGGDWWSVHFFQRPILDRWEIFVKANNSYIDWKNKGVRTLLSITGHFFKIGKCVRKKRSSKFAIC